MPTDSKKPEKKRNLLDRATRTFAANMTSGGAPDDDKRYLSEGEKSALKKSMEPGTGFLFRKKRKAKGSAADTLNGK